VTAAGAGLSIGNGVRLVVMLWQREHTERLWYRVVRLAVAPVGLSLVAIFHFPVPAAVVVLMAAGLIVERVRAKTA
jgi:hypothetical protein